MGKKKTRKMRGKKTFGYGSKKKHRGGGSRGGRGMAGSFKHKKLKIIKENPGYYGKRGFRKKNKKTVQSINLAELENLASKLGKDSIDLTELGYDKVLGKGRLTRPLKIKVSLFSSKAKKKIEEVGGSILETSEESSPEK